MPKEKQTEMAAMPEPDAVGKAAEAYLDAQDVLKVKKAKQP